MDSKVSSKFGSIIASNRIFIPPQLEATSGFLTANFLNVSTAAFFSYSSYPSAKATNEFANNFGKVVESTTIHLRINLIASIISGIVSYLESFSTIFATNK